MKKFKDIANEEVFQHHIVQGNTENGKVAHTGTLKQMQKKIRDPKMGSDHVLVKTRHDLKTGDNWKKHMHAESVGDIVRRAVEKQELAEATFWQIKIPGIPDPVFIESSSKASIRKGLRSQLKPDVWKETEIERITKPAMVKMYRRLAKEGPSDESEETNEGIEEGKKDPEIRKDAEKAVDLLKKKGIGAKYKRDMYRGHRIYVQRDDEKKALKIVPKELSQYIFGTIDAQEDYREPRIQINVESD